MKSIETGFLFYGNKYEIFKIKDFCGICEITYRVAPNYHKAVRLFSSSDIDSKNIYNFLKPHIKNFYDQKPAYRRV